MLIFLLLIIGTVTACSPAMRAPSTPPLREADLYPVNQAVEGLTIAVDEIADQERARRYFGSDLAKDGILPINIIISNHGEDRLIVKPSDVLLTDGSRVIDPIPGDQVVKDGTGTLLQETVVPPGGNYQGMMFFPMKKQEGGLYGRVEKFFSDKMTLRMVVKDQDSGERLYFGPYSISGY
jgi:hypothetical protein